ncbi:MAG: response regulator [Nitrospirae bacterium]|nr:response regulator [Nitrospirota bacterium]MBF0519151.1 response regulator [Nitrospirota bacterium]MBF0535049.1 response regulator [Nitrospirota bacterium]MBF0616557.1 response regulator [Nitrospirota bacterium]
MKIMVVDDDKTTRKILGLYLKGGGHEPVFAENGLDAIEKLAANEVDLILTDLNMPYMDGIELTKTLKTDPSFKDIPLVMITTENDEAERSKAMAAGANGYLVKPISADTLNKNVKIFAKKN